MNEPIRSKQHFQRLWDAEKLGNKPHTWRTLQEFKKSCFQKKVSLRYCGKNGGAPLITNILPADVPSRLADLIRQGWKENDYYIIEQISPEIIRYRINGEVMRKAPEGLALYFSLENKFMRPALLSSGRQVYGLVASTILQHHLEPSDHESLINLLDEYPDHTIEFSGFNKYVGIQPRRKMIIWEVRLY